jgi:hypothetical protein
MSVTIPATGSGDATPVVETIAGVASANRQVMTIGDRAGGAVDSIGGLTETAPGTDTASSGLNGRTIALDPGQSWTIPPLASGVNVKANSGTSGHKFFAMKW